MELVDTLPNDIFSLDSYLEQDMAIEKISYSLLPENYFSNLKNHLTAKGLQLLSEQAKKIPVPPRFGEIIDDNHYLQTLEFVLNSTIETKHRCLFFLKNILPRLQSYDALLDVGVGDGQLTNLISRNFKLVTAMETNKVALDNLGAKKKIIKKNATLHKIHGSILNTKLPDNHYDLGVLSHILYYIDQSKWLETIENAYKTIKPGGFIAIVLSGDGRGKADLIKYFGGNPLGIDNLIKDCSNKFNTDIEVFESNETFYAKNMSSMLHIAGFFLRDSEATATHKELEAYLNLHHRKHKNKFEMTSQQKFILIHKT
jgi:SAM-dependent methyltransferase